MIAINGWQCEVIVEWVKSESLHDGEDGDTVPPDISTQIIHFLAIDGPSIQVDSASS